jgi:hypothetical protein
MNLPVVNKITIKIKGIKVNVYDGIKIHNYKNSDIIQLEYATNKKKAFLSRSIHNRLM